MFFDFEFILFLKLVILIISINIIQMIIDYQTKNVKLLAIYQKQSLNIILINHH